MLQNLEDADQETRMAYFMDHQTASNFTRGDVTKAERDAATASGRRNLSFIAGAGASGKFARHELRQMAKTQKAGGLDKLLGQVDTLNGVMIDLSKKFDSIIPLLDKGIKGMNKLLKQLGKVF